MTNTPDTIRQALADITKIRSVDEYRSLLREALDQLDAKDTEIDSLRRDVNAGADHGLKLVSQIAERDATIAKMESVPGYGAFMVLKDRLAHAAAENEELRKELAERKAIAE